MNKPKTENLLLRASAGTGKTFALATRFLRLFLFGGVPPERILAITFSRNAAQEIYVKILERLWKASSSPKAASKETKALLDGLSRTDRKAAKSAFDGKPASFRRALRGFLDAQGAGSIATLDGFILRVVRAFPLETEFADVPDVLDGYAEARVAADARGGLLAARGPDGATDGRAFLSARDNASSRTVGTALEDVLKKWSGFLEARPAAAGWTAAGMRKALGVDSSTEEGRTVLKALDAVAAKLRLAAGVRERRRAGASALSRFSFADFTDALARRQDSKSAPPLKPEDLAFRLGARFDHWMLDEFQDTSETQWRALRPFVLAAAQSARDGRGSAMAVGDLKQSIYVWRGGNDAPFKELMGWPEFAGAFGRSDTLPESHRYGRHTVDFVNAVFGPDNVRPLAADRPEAVKRWLSKDCWMEHRLPKKGDGKVPDDYVGVFGVVPPADGDAGNDGEDDGGTAAMRVLAPAICDFVEDFWKKHERVHSSDTFGILVRGNDDGALLAGRLRDRGVPVVWEGLSSVLDSPVVGAVLDLLALAEHPRDSFAWKTANDLFPVRKRAFPKQEDAESVSAAVADLLSRLGFARALREIVFRVSDKGGLDDRTRLALDALVREAAAFEARPGADGAGTARFRLWLEKAAGRETAVSPHVVRILTIHRAKGLTLDHVLVPIPEKGKSSIIEANARRTILSGNEKGKGKGEGWALDGFAGKAKDQVAAREAVPALEEARGRASDETLLEALRTWYVALTRARKSVRVFVVDEGPSDTVRQFRDLLRAPWKGGKSRRRAGTSRAEPWRKDVTVLYEAGTPKPAPYGFAAKKTKGKGKKGAEKKNAAVWPSASAETPVEHVTPSSAERDSPRSGTRGRPRKPVSFFDAEFGEEARKGVDEHAAYAAIEWIDPKKPKNARERKILTRDGTWREAFRETSDATVWRERSYERMRDASHWETGQFDRVVFRGDGAKRTAEIYDFKTDAKRKGESGGAFAARMRATYASQMDAYRAALAKLTGIRPSRISVTLLLASTGTSVEV